MGDRHRRRLLCVCFLPCASEARRANVPGSGRRARRDRDGGVGARAAATQRAGPGADPLDVAVRLRAPVTARVAVGQ